MGEGRAWRKPQTGKHPNRNAFHRVRPHAVSSPHQHPLAGGHSRSTRGNQLPHEGQGQWRARLEPDRVLPPWVRATGIFIFGLEEFKDPSQDSLENSPKMPPRPGLRLVLLDVSHTRLRKDSGKRSNNSHTEFKGNENRVQRHPDKLTLLGICTNSLGCSYDKWTYFPRVVNFSIFWLMYTFWVWWRY